MTEVSNWLLSWFEQGGPIPGTTLEEKLQVNYFESGLIDSMGVIELIAGVEDHFDIRFTERHFQERRFSFIGGLSEIIIQILQGEEGTNGVD